MDLGGWGVAINLSNDEFIHPQEGMITTGKIIIAHTKPKYTVSAYHKCLLKGCHYFRDAL